jgi:voltage-gated potassium channel Kch
MTRPLQDHYIVCGMGHVGFRIALLLRRLNLPVAAIYDRVPDPWLHDAINAGVACFQGDARNEKLLKEAGVERAKGLIAVTDKDMVNLSVALDGLRLNPTLAVTVRMFDQELGRYLNEQLPSVRALSASALAAPVFVAAALGDEALCCFDLGEHSYVVVGGNAPVDEGSDVLPLFGKTEGRIEPIEPAAPIAKQTLAIRQATGARKAQPGLLASTTNAAALARAAFRGIPPAVHILMCGLTLVILTGIVTVRSTMHLSYLDSFYFIMTTITTTGYGDVSFLHAPVFAKLVGCALMVSGAAMLALLFGIITDALISRRFRGVLAGNHVRRRGHIVLAGTGNITPRIVQEILHEKNEVIVISPGGQEAAALRGLRIPVIEGDARLEAVLQHADIKHAAAVIAVHDDDVINLGIALLAKKLNPNLRAVVRVFDGEFAEKLEHQLAVDRVMSVSAVSAPTFVAACLSNGVKQATVWEHCLLVLRESQKAGSGPESDLSTMLSQDSATGTLSTQKSGVGEVREGERPALHVTLHKLRDLE